MSTKSVIYSQKCFNKYKLAKFYTLEGYFTSIQKSLWWRSKNIIHHPLFIYGITSVNYKSGPAEGILSCTHIIWEHSQFWSPSFKLTIKPLMCRIFIQYHYQKFNIIVLWWARTSIKKSLVSNYKHKYFGMTAHFHIVHWTNLWTISVCKYN